MTSLRSCWQPCTMSPRWTHCSGFLTSRWRSTGILGCRAPAVADADPDFVNHWNVRPMEFGGRGSNGGTGETDTELAAYLLRPSAISWTARCSTNQAVTGPTPEARSWLRGRIVQDVAKQTRGVVEDVVQLRLCSRAAGLFLRKSKNSFVKHTDTTKKNYASSTWLM